MANNKSAKKRIKINSRNKSQNRYYKTSVRNLTRKFFRILEIWKVSGSTSDKDNLKTILSSIHSVLDKGTKKKVFHKNMATRQKVRLATYLKSA